MLGGVALIVAAVVVAEGWLLAEARWAVRTAGLALARKQQEGEKLAALTPAPTVTQATAIERDLERTDERWAALQAGAWNPEATVALLAAAAKTSVSRTDAFFGLADFVRRMRELAAPAGVRVRTEEHFGFAAYDHAGPEPNLIAPVLRQRQIAGYLLENLFASRLRQLVAVQRARLPQGNGEGIAATQNEDGDLRARGDVFEIDPRFSIGQPGMIETTAFRVTFVGHTAALRGFLNRLAAGGIPVVVRSVEAEPVKETPLQRQVAPGSADPLALIVRPAWSRFAVTVEFCEIALPPPRAGNTLVGPSSESGATRADVWPDPPAQRRGRGWIYDVFTPPSLYRDSQAGRLSAVPTGDGAPADPADADIDLQLVEVRRGLFRLQLVGYAGGPENLRGIFVHSSTGETMIGHGGERLAAQGLAVKRIDLCRARTGGKEGEATTDVVATATVQDESTGEEVVLTNREPCLAGAPLGLFTSRKTQGFRCELREGESVALNGVNYCITHIDLQPPQALIACITPGTIEPSLRTLTPQHAPPAADVIPARTASEKHSKGTPGTP